MGVVVVVPRSGRLGNDVGQCVSVRRHYFDLQVQQLEIYLKVQSGAGLGGGL